METEPEDASIESLEGRGPRTSARALPRRTVLRAAGLTVGLPWLEAMASAMPNGANEPWPTRAVWVYAPNGVRIDEWRTDVPYEGKKRNARPVAGEYEMGELPRLLAPLEPFRERLQILRGLTHDKARANGDGPGDHARAAAAYLTGVQPLKTEGRVKLGISADQLAARHIGGATRVRSLALGLERGRQSGQCDSGYACAYSGHVSWESPTVPASKEVDPRRAFDRLFRGGDPAASATARLRRLETRRSVLDFVRADSKRLARKLGREDRSRIDEYETGLRELERKLGFDGAAHEARAADDERPDGIPKTFREHAELLGRVVALALRTDTTRIVTLMLANEGSNRRYNEVGVREGHHSLSHHGGDEKKLADIGRINRLHVEAFTEFVTRLTREPEADGSVFDRTIVTFGSGIAEGNRHDHHDLPIALVSGARTGLRGGRVVATERDRPMNDLHLALLERLGVRGVTLGDSTGVLEGV